MCVFEEGAGGEKLILLFGEVRKGVEVSGGGNKRETGVRDSMMMMMIDGTLGINSSRR
jgi:hypothetical protein